VFQSCFPKGPSPFMKASVWCSQLIAWNAFFWFYLAMPRTCHRFVGYLEEEAVHTYSSAIRALDQGLLPSWVNKPCPEIGIKYWRLKDDATMRDLLLHVRADEAQHRDVNHAFASLIADDPNPFIERERRQPSL